MYCVEVTGLNSDLDHGTLLIQSTCLARFDDTHFKVLIVVLISTDYVCLQY